MTELLTWDELAEQCSKCRKCSLSSTRTNVVFGRGNREADLMFVGEAPGEQEDLQGLPFVGAAGQLFEKYMLAVGMDSSEVYIANILKCRPPKNRDPEPEECDACMDFLRQQVRLIKPKMIVCLGRIAAQRLIDPDYRITRDHGNIVKKGQFSITAVYHPAALLRDPSKKEDMYRDLKKIKEHLTNLRKNSPASIGGEMNCAYN